MVYVQHVFKTHPEQVFLRYFWLFLWLHSGLEICKVIRVILPKTCKFNTHNSPTFLYKSMCYDLFRSDYLFLTQTGSTNYAQAGLLGAILFLTALLTNYLVHKTEESAEIASQREIDLANMEQLTQFIM